jgi:hypothetical protein
MVFPILGNHFSRDFVLENIFEIGRDLWMITSMKRLRRIIRETSREVVTRNCLLLVRHRREKDKFLARRVTMMEAHHSQGRRKT